MRFKIIFILIFLLVMASLPTAVAIFSGGAEKTALISTYDEGSVTKSDEEILCGLVAAEYREEYCDEALKALAVILNTDYKSSPESFDLNDRSVCIFEEDAEDELKDDYPRIKAAVGTEYKKTLCARGKAFFIPFSYISNGYTVKSSDYPYLNAVASTWDCFSQSYSDNAECIGVSMYGINYLCENGADYSEALKWYLPDFEIYG